MTTLAARTPTTASATPYGAPLDAAWPRTPVAHLAFETDTHFATIHCPSR